MAGSVYFKAMLAALNTVTAAITDKLLVLRNDGTPALVPFGSFPTGATVGNAENSDPTVIDWHEEGSFTATYTGMTGTVTGVIFFTRDSKKVVLEIPSLTGTSNNTSFTITGMPTVIRPSVNKNILVAVKDAGAASLGLATINSSGVITLSKDMSGTGFTATGVKGTVQLNGVPYSL